MTQPAAQRFEPSAVATEDDIPGGFRFAAATAGIKASGTPDISMIVTDRPVTAAGVYTTNQVYAAPVAICRQRTPMRAFRGVITNSGNANACTGQRGIDDATTMTRRLAQKIGCDAEQVLVMSTGVIGRPLPMDKVTRGIDAAFDALQPGAAAFTSAADAIRTTDQYRKVAFARVSIGGQTVRIAAMAKGAGMIAPNMATLLSVVLTDASLAPAEANAVLRHAAGHSFNSISVDGHTSTNDTLLLLASGDATPLTGSDLQTFQEAITGVLVDLGKMIVADGEGSRHFMNLCVQGAQSDAQAKTIGTVVAASPLVKTAITGGDPNWGRIVSAAGYAGPTIQPAKTSLWIKEQCIYRDGTPLEFDAKSLSSLMRSTREVQIRLVVGDGPGCATVFASDLTTNYVNFNAEYTT